MSNLKRQMAVFLMAGVLSAGPLFAAADSLPPLSDGKVPTTVDELWAGYNPQAEPLEAQIAKEWETDGIVCRIVRYRIGVFKGAPATMAAFYAFPKGGTKLPALVQIHGGGQSANLDGVMIDAKRGYASMSLNWGGNKLNFGQQKIDYDGPNTDWGNVDATHPPQRNKVNHFAGVMTPDEYTVDPVESPRNSNWFLVLIGARRAITFLEQQPEVDASKIGVCGHSMGGTLTTDLAGIDKRVKAAVPSCGGSGILLTSQVDVPGGIKTSPSAMGILGNSDNPYIPRITCPVLWLSPTNDFNASIDNMSYNWRVVPDEQLRFSITPHLNHRHTDAHFITQYLWFEQNLKGVFTMPRTPRLELNLKTADGIPEVTVTPDGSMPVEGVDLYYSIDPHVLSRFWRDAGAVKDGVKWRAACPVMSVDQPLFVYADVIYELPDKYRKISVPRGQENTAVFAISSRELLVNSTELHNAGVKATDAPNRMIDDGGRGWHDWYRLNWDHPPLWMAFTRKLKDPKWRGPDGASLNFDVQCKTDRTLFVRFTCNSWGAFSPGKPELGYIAAKEIKGSPDWQTVSVSLSDLSPTDPKVTTPLANWRTVTELTISPSDEIVKDGKKVRVEAKSWEGPRDLRNLRWEGGEYPKDPTAESAGSALDAKDLQKGFNDAIKKSLDQEAKDRK